MLHALQIQIRRGQPGALPHAGLQRERLLLRGARLGQPRALHQVGPAHCTPDRAGCASWCPCQVLLYIKWERRTAPQIVLMRFLVPLSDAPGGGINLIFISPGGWIILGFVDYVLLCHLGFPTIMYHYVI